MFKKRRVLFSLLSIIVSGIVILGVLLKEAQSILLTLDNMAIIQVIICATLNEENWQSGYEPIKMCFSFKNKNYKEVICSIPFDGENFLDAWGRPIIIKNQKEDKEFYIELRSNGRDGKLGTHDDLIIQGWKSK